MAIKRPLWATAPKTHGVDGEWIGDDDRHENWSETVPSALLVKFVDMQFSTNIILSG
jgi:hypothetical protein